MSYNEKSMKNLRPNWNTETAKAAQEKGLETRRKNKEEREKLKLTINEMKLVNEEVFKEADISALDVLKLAMTKAVQAEDMDEATRLAAILAEYQQPKLQRVDQTNLELDAGELSEEELEKKIQELSKDN